MSYLNKDGLIYLWSKIKAYITTVLADYVKKTDIEDYFDIDVDGGLEPTLNPTVSTKWVLDSNGDIEPKEV
jgi:hypothetical protein